MRLGKPIRLRDFIRVGDFYFSVIGYRHDNGVKCFLRYVPDEKGDRVKDGKKFRKLLHEEAVKFALDSGMEYFDGHIFVVPVGDVDEVFKPEERLVNALKSKEVRKVVEFFSGIPRNEMGVTGSRLIGLEGSESDVDFVMYGKWWFEGREKIRKGIERGTIAEPDSDTWEFIYRKRKVNVPYDVFLAHEKRKFHRAVIGSTYFDLLYVRGYDELDKDIPEEKGIKLGIATVVAEVLDDGFVFDYPAYYLVKHGKIDAILAFTHTYVGQAFKGEVLEARGHIEEINGKKYLIVGTKRETEDEYIVSLTFLESAGLLDEFRKWKGSL